MIVDRLTSFDSYRGLGPGIAAAFDYLAETDFSTIGDGRHELPGGAFAMVARYRTKPLDSAVWEAHRRYVDVQFVVAGTERMGYVPLADELSVTTPYTVESDVLFFDAAGDLLTVPAGMFTIYSPHDVHAPGLQSADGPADVLKVVVKVPVEQAFPGGRF